MPDPITDEPSAPAPPAEGDTEAREAGWLWAVVNVTAVLGAVA